MLTLSLLAVTATSGCLGPESVFCGSGVICPPGRACDDVHGRCVLLEQLSVCDTLEQGQSCIFPSAPPGAYTCQERVCLPDVWCGNGMIESNEVCDDGNQVSGDGCSADCRSDETCGNGVVDLARGEACDDGNLRSEDGCSSTCAAETPQWEQITATMQGRLWHAMAYDSQRERVVMFGGTTVYDPLQGLTNELSEHWEFDGVGWTHVYPPSVPTARVGHAMTYDPRRGKVVLFGGFGIHGWLGDTWEFDGVTWQQISPLVSPTARYDHAMTYDASRQRVVLFGGVNEDDVWGMTDLWEYDGVTWMEVVPTTPASPVVEPTLVYDGGRSRLVLFGGYDAAAEVDTNRTWEFVNGGWQKLSPPTSPPPRCGAASVYDPVAERVLVYGGALCSYQQTGDLPAMGDTWAFDGTTWTQLPSPSSPDARFGHAMVWQDSIDRAVLFGGVVRQTPAADTWAFDGTTWARLAIGNAPVARYGHAMVYDELRERVVMFGGCREGGEPLGDTWKYTTAGWTHVAVTLAPAARCRPLMIYDSARQAVLLYGGLADGVSFTDTWQFDGIGWEELSVGEPPPISGQLMAYDAAREQVVLVGTSDDQAEIYKTWVLKDGLWAEAPGSQATPAGVAMAYDPDRRVTVLYASEGLWPIIWEYDGVVWSQRSVENIPATANSQHLVWDGKLGRLMMLAGPAAENMGLGVWSYGGDRWLEHLLTPYPSSENLGAVAYDSARNRLVIFGGLQFMGAPLDTTWEFAFVGTGELEDCGDSVDNDGDGLTDCADPDCRTMPECPSVENCSDSVDQGSDGVVDCEDPVCGGRSCGAYGLSCIGLTCGCAAGVTEDCHDGLDNDCDGLVDCLDTESCGADSGCN